MTDSPLKIEEKRCKSCAKCVRICPAGVLSMRSEPGSIYGIMVNLDRLDLCIGCNKCEDACPDIAIWVASKKEHLEWFAKKLTDEAREQQAKILANDCRSLEEEKVSK